MVDNAAVVAADPRGFQPSRTARVVGELWNLFGRYGERVVVNQENQLPPQQYRR